MRASLMEQQRQLNDNLVHHRRPRRRRHHQQHHDDDDDDDDEAFSGVVVVKETGTCSGHVTNITQCLDDSNSESGASSRIMSTSSDNGLDTFFIIIGFVFSRPPSTLGKYNLKIKEFLNE